jgi:hypothetical protein
MTRPQLPVRISILAHQPLCQASALSILLSSSGTRFRVAGACDVIEVSSALSNRSVS